MYSSEERMKAIALYIRYDRASAPTIRELGYPSRKALYRWYREYERPGDFHAQFRKGPNCSTVQKHAAAEYYFERGHNLATTVRALGYPSRGRLRMWIDELRPAARLASRWETGRRNRRGQIQNQIRQPHHLPIGVNTAHLVEGEAFDPEFRDAELRVTHFTQTQKRHHQR